MCLQCASLLLRGKGVEMGAINPPPLRFRSRLLLAPRFPSECKTRAPPSLQGFKYRRRQEDEKGKEISLALAPPLLSFLPSSSSYHAGGGRSSFRFSLEVGEGGRGGFLPYLSHATNFPSTFVSCVLFRPLLLLPLQVVSMSGAPFSRSNPSRLSSEGKG